MCIILFFPDVIQNAIDATTKKTLRARLLRREGDRIKAAEVAAKNAMNASN